MITVNVLKKETYFDLVTLSGHAMYDDFGKDIVCSAVSSIVTTSINGILSIDEKALTYELIEDGMKISINSTDNVTQTLTQNMINLLSELAQKYPKNIQIK